MKNSNHFHSEVSRRQWLAELARTCLGVRLAAPISRSCAYAASAKQGTARNVIYLYMEGGQSHLDTWDPKVGDVAGPTKAIKTSVEGIQLSEHLALTAKQMHHGAVIRSLASTQGAHAQGNYFMHTSYQLRGTIKHPSIGSWLAHYQGAGNADLPASVYVGNSSGHPGEGFLPPHLAPFLVSNPDNGLQNIRPQNGATMERFTTRFELAQQFGNAFRSTYPHRKVKAQAQMYEGALRLMKSSDLGAFDLTQESAAHRSAYGLGAFGQGCLLARRLIERGVRFVEVGLNGWDTHINNFSAMPKLCGQLDQGLATLVADLASRGLLEETLVVVATEFGRTPQVNVNEGRDHYPQAFSAAMFGGGIKGGFSFGATDQTGSQVIDGKVSVPDLNATIAHALGLPLEEKVSSPSGRPFTVADKGKPILELFA
jgi:hypothetical protein